VAFAGGIDGLAGRRTLVSGGGRRETSPAERSRRCCCTAMPTRCR